MYRSISLILVLVLLLGCDDPASSPASKMPAENALSFGPLRKIDRDFDAALAGIWQSRGYGWVFAIRDGQLTQYQHAGAHCFLTPANVDQYSGTLSLSYNYYKLGSDPDQAILQLLPDDTEVRVNRLDELPPACHEERQYGYGEMLDYFAAMMAEHYAFFDRRSIDWPARVATARSEVSSVSDDQQFFALLAAMIDGFSDSHTKLLADIDGQAMRQQDGLGPTLTRIQAQDAENPWMIGIFGGLMQDVLDSGASHTANDRILWGTIDNGRIGYFQILTMGGFSGVDLGDPDFRDAEFRVFDEVMDTALGKMQTAEFVVVDLSNNRGGYDAIARRLLSRFTDSNVVAYRTEVPASGVAPRARLVEPATGVRYTGPVVLFTSDVTVSGGELASIGMRRLPNVTHIGGTARGSFSTVLAKPLPNGWVVELSNEVLSDADGTVFEETGIPPAVELDLFPVDDPVGGYFEALRAAIAHADGALTD